MKKSDLPAGKRLDVLVDYSPEKSAWARNAIYEDVNYISFENKNGVPCFIVNYDIYDESREDIYPMNRIVQIIKMIKPEGDD